MNLIMMIVVLITARKFFGKLSLGYRQSDQIV